MRLLNTVMLTTAALCFAAGNVWYAAVRSTIPLSLSGGVEAVEMRREKHPGKDDVYLLRLNNGRVLQVDGPVAEVIGIGDSIKKDAWSRTLQVDSRVVELSWSSDVHGMMRAMPIVWLTVTLTAAWVYFSGFRAAQTLVAPSNDFVDRISESDGN